MKIIHTSDWHLGRMLYGRSLLEDQQYFIEKFFLEFVMEKMPSLVLISGDIYDRQIAPPEAIRLFDKTLSRLAEMGVKTGIISGNHDSADRMALMKPQLRKLGIYIATTIEDAMEPILLEEGGERLQLFLLPFADNATVRAYFEDDSLRGEEACMRRLLEELETKQLPDATKLLCAHCFVSGATTSDSESTVFVGGSGQIAADIFSGYDYVALGHLHGPQRVGTNGRYSGSPLKYSVDEQGHKKSMVELELKNGLLDYRLVEIPALRDVRRIEGSFNEILAAGQAESCQDYVEIILNDESPVLMAAEQLAPYYKKLLAVRNNWLAASSRAEGRRKLNSADEITIFGSFMKEICDIEPDEEQWKLFKEILKESK